MAEKERPNCYMCKWRRSVVGSAHSRCTHPVVVGEPGHTDPLQEALAILGAVGRGFGPSPAQAIIKLGIQTRARGHALQWFVWPYNFDPVWLMACNGFEEVQSE